MNSKILVAATLTAFALSTAALADDALVVTAEKAAQGTAVGLDYSSSGQATAIEFRLSVGEAKGTNVNLSGCLKDLPSTHAGQCSFAKGAVIGIVYSDTNALLPRGMISLGSIGISSKATPELTTFIASDAQAQALKSSVKMDSDAVVNTRIVR